MTNDRLRMVGRRRGCRRWSTARERGQVPGWLAASLAALGDSARFAAEFRRGVAAARAQLDSGSAVLGGVLVRYGAFLCSTGGAAMGTAMVRTGIGDIASHDSGGEPPSDLLVARTFLGSCLIRSGQPAAAARLLAHTHDTLAARYGARDYRAMAAERWRRQADQLASQEPGGSGSPGRRDS